jgi:hypothetical protein
LTNSNPANKLLRKIVKDSRGDYKLCKRDGKKAFILSLVNNFRKATSPTKRRFLERPANDMPWSEVPMKKVYVMIQRMLIRNRKEEHPEVVDYANQATPHGCAVSRELRKPPPPPYGANGTNGEAGACLKAESYSHFHEAASSPSPDPPPPASRKARKRRKTSNAKPMARRRYDIECVVSVNQNDVMCDGGIRHGADDFRGNALLFEHLYRYKKELQPEGADDRQIAERVVHHIRHTDPPGRFLKENADGKWHHIGTCCCRRRPCCAVSWTYRTAYISVAWN